VLAHGHLVGVKESYGIGFHPDEVIPEPLPIGIDEVGGEGLGGGDDRGAVGLQDAIELPPHELKVRPDVPVAVGHTVGRICENEVDDTVGDSFDAGFIVFEEDVVEEAGREHEESLALYLTYVKYICDKTAHEYF